MARTIPPGAEGCPTDRTSNIGHVSTNQPPVAFALSIQVTREQTMGYVVWWTLFGIALTFYTVWAARVWGRKPKRQEEL